LVRASSSAAVVWEASCCPMQPEAVPIKKAPPGVPKPGHPLSLHLCDYLTPMADAAEALSIDNCHLNSYSKEAVEAVTTNSGVASTKPGWSIVWCHERCHKQENQAFHKRMRADAAKHGSSLVLVKKAPKFIWWVRRMHRPAFLLVTDWREARPYIKCLATLPAMSRPFQIVVLCESQRQLGKASAWAQHISSESGPITVCLRSDIPASLLHGILRRHFGTSGKSDSKASELVFGTFSPQIWPREGTCSTPIAPTESDAAGQEAISKTSEDDCWSRTISPRPSVSTVATNANEARLHPSRLAPVKLMRGSDGALCVCECAEGSPSSQFNHVLFNESGVAFLN